MPVSTADTQQNMLQDIISEVWKLLEPSIEVLSDPSKIAQLEGALGATPSGNTMSSPGADEIQAITDFINNSEGSLEEFLKVLPTLYAVSESIWFLVDALAQSNSGDANLATSDISTAILNMLANSYLQENFPKLYNVVLILSLLDEQSANTGNVISLFDQIGNFFANAAAGFGVVADASKQNDKIQSASDLLFFPLAGSLVFLANKLDFDYHVVYGYDGPANSPTPNKDLIARRTFSLAPKIKLPAGSASGSASLTPKISVALVPTWDKGLALQTNINGDFKISDATPDNYVTTIDIGGGGQFRFGNLPSAQSSDPLTWSVEFKHDSDSPVRKTLFDSKIKFTLGYGRASFKISASEDDFDINLKADVPILLDHSADAGFPYNIIPHVDQTFSIGLGYSIKKGFYVEGGGKKIIMIVPVYKQLGPFDFQVVTLILSTNDGPPTTYSLETSVDFSITIGSVVKASFMRVGLLTTIQKEGTPHTSIGIFGYSISPGFKPPNGAAIAIDAGIVSGGGFLYIDNDKGEYSGAIELSVADLFSVKAVGIIDTKMPDGTKGFSMIVIICAEFTPVQLGFGFMLIGVGGILGINRTMDENALINGVRSNALQSILFPPDVIGNIQRIISDIGQFFPPMQEHFVIGLMLKIEWAELVDIELGVIIDLPNPVIAIVGIIKVVLPDQDDIILKLQVNFAGIIDTQHGFVFFRADLFDSHLLTFTLTGSFAFVISWGDKKMFAITSGGFHPAFKDIPAIPQIPDGFKNLARIGISILNEDDAKLKVDTYFAVTSNTVQFGAHAELYVGVSEFNLYGNFSFDALFILDPFHFTISLSACLALRTGSDVIAGLNISVQLSGPELWNIQGEASYSFLFFDITIPFNYSWGTPPSAIPAAAVDLRGILQTELADTTNWRPVIPDNNHLHVTLKDIVPAEGEIVVHPMGILTFSQRSFPLNNYLIQKYGSGVPAGLNKFSLTGVNSGGIDLQPDFINTTESFAVGNFTNLSDSDKLSRNSFDNLPSGFQITGTTALATSLPVDKDINYRLSYLHQQTKNYTKAGLVTLPVSVYRSGSQAASIRKSVLSNKNNVALNAPQKVAPARTQFAIANVGDMKQAVPVLLNSEAEAYQKYNELVAATPGLNGNIQVVYHFELAN